MPASPADFTIGTVKEPKVKLMEDLRISALHGQIFAMRTIVRLLLEERAEREPDPREYLKRLKTAGLDGALRMAAFFFGSLNGRAPDKRAED